MNVFEGVNISHDRYAWADILKILSAFAVVWIHTTSGAYNDFQNKDWIWYLLINSIQTFGVPCFYMVSGAFLLSSNTSIKVVLKKRVPRILIPLIFWSAVYILVRKYISGENVDILISIVRSFFEPQYWHLWFMYPMLGLYFLIPVIASLFKNKDTHDLFTYSLILFLVVPAVFYSILTITGFWTDKPWFALGFPELGLFILGKVIFDKREQIIKYKKYFLILIIFGFLLTVISTYFISMNSLAAKKDFFNAQRFPVIIFCTSVYTFFVCSFKNVNTRLKSVLSELGRLSFGIYLMHPLLMTMIRDIQLPGPVDITINTGSNFDMFFGAVFYFVLSGIISYLISRIPIFNKLI